MENSSCIIQQTHPDSCHCLTHLSFDHVYSSEKIFIGNIMKHNKIK